MSNGIKSLQAIYRHFYKLSFRVHLDVKRYCDLVRSLHKHVDWLIGVGGLDLDQVDRCRNLIQISEMRLKPYTARVRWSQVRHVMAILRIVRQEMTAFARAFGAPSVRTLFELILPPGYELPQDDYSNIFTPIGFKSEVASDNHQLGPRRDDTFFAKPSPWVELSGMVINVMIGQVLHQIHGFLISNPEHTFLSMGPLPSYNKVFAEITRSASPVPEIHQSFNTRFMTEMLPRDVLCMHVDDILNQIRKFKKENLRLLTRPVSIIYSEFQRCSIYDKRNKLVMLMLGPDAMQRKGRYVYSKFSLDKQKRVLEILLRYVSPRIRSRLYTTQIISTPGISVNRHLSYADRVRSLNAGIDVIQKGLERVQQMESRDSDGKAKHYVEGLLRIPFGCHRKEPIFWETEIFQTYLDDAFEGQYTKTEAGMLKFSENQGGEVLNKWRTLKQKQKEFMEKMRQNLDSTILGQNSAKTHLERLMANWITGSLDGAIIGIQGPPGVGKTTLIKEGLARCLISDEGDVRPFFLYPLGGMTRASTLVGHNYTYSGATWGRIVDMIMTAGCMNPIILFDELDKVSTTAYGQEIIGILTHLTDKTQNQEFYDRYFDGVALDMSKAIFVFSYNDESRIDRILLDRMTVVRTTPLYHYEKLCIGQQYAWPQIMKNLGYAPEDIIMSESVMSTVVSQYTNEAGVRRLKQLLLEIAQEVNRQYLLDLISISWPKTLHLHDINKILGEYPSITQRRIRHSPGIGVVHGMYATTYGLGGITTIEVCEIAGSEDRKTGTLGKVMLESVDCAKTVASRMSKEMCVDLELCSVHIHLPEASTPKDGPSAGVALALALISLWTHTPLRNTVSITGEIDLSGNVLPVGGLEHKLYGAKMAGVKLAIVPAKNMNDLTKLRQQKTLSGGMRTFEDATFQVLMVNTIKEALGYFL